MDNKVQIESISCRRILNSHGEFTNEFVLRLNNGSKGRGASPQGESISIYEDQQMDIPPQILLDDIKRDGMLDKPIKQEEFDRYLEEKITSFGRNNTYALSLAFFNAHGQNLEVPTSRIRKIADTQIPKICLNILNGGNHAYTNPVQSEFQEYMLVSKKNDLIAVLDDHNLIQKRVKEKLARKEKIYVNNNVVARSEHGDNRDWFDFIHTILKELGLESDYDQMIDASASDLWTGKEYHFAITDHSLKNNEDMCTYWLDLIKDFNLNILEDPFHETDFNSWYTLTSNQSGCKIVGDNLYSGDPERIEMGIRKELSHGVVLKPNQAGTVSNTIRAINLIQQNNHTLITSHRSKSTESTFLAVISKKYNAEYIKIGPILTDYSSILRLNELIRLTGTGYE